MYIEKELKLFRYIYKKINQSYPKQETFSFREISETETLDIIKSVPKNKAAVFKDIPMRGSSKKRLMFTLTD